MRVPDASSSANLFSLPLFFFLLSQTRRMRRSVRASQGGGLKVVGTDILIAQLGPVANIDVGTVRAHIRGR